MSSSGTTMQHNLGFVFFGERPSLDFANTLRRRKDPLHPTVDLLSETGSIRNWLASARKATEWTQALPPLAPVCGDPPPTDIAKLREAILLLANERLGISTAKAADLTLAISTINSWAAERPVLQLSAPRCQDSARDHRSPQVLAPNLTLEQLLGLVATDAVSLFGTDAQRRLKECAHRRCGMLFEDRSNGQRRQWCSMKECGNRAKVRRHSMRK